MIACVDIICGILLAFVRTREVGVSSRNVVSRSFPHFSQSMLTPMIITPPEHVKMYLFQMLFTNSQKGAYGSSPHQHITQPMETLLTKYTSIVLLDFVYT